MFLKFFFFLYTLIFYKTLTPPPFLPKTTRGGLDLNKIEYMLHNDALSQVPGSLDKWFWRRILKITFLYYLK